MNRHPLAGPALTVLAILVVDRLTKWAAIGFLQGRPMRSLLWDTFRLVYVENPGAFLILGANFSPTVRRWVFTAAVAMVLAALAVYIWRARHRETGRMLAALSLFLAGGLGNLVDRLAYGGYVIDFMNVGVGWLRTGVFNVADMALTAGVALLLLQSLWPQATVTAGQPETGPDR